MTTTNRINHIAVIGRLHGDDEDVCLLFEGKTVPEARQAFIDELRSVESIPEEDIVAELEYTNVYITHTMTSATPMNLEA